MPLREGRSKKTISRNIKEMMKTKPSAAREKAIRTYMRRHNCSYEEAKRILASAAAYSKARKSKKKKRKK